MTLSLCPYFQADYKEQIPRQTLRFMGDNASKFLREWGLETAMAVARIAQRQRGRCRCW